MELTFADACELSNRFRDLSREVTRWRTQHSSEPDLRQCQGRLEDLEARLLTIANELTTAAVGLILDESETSAESLKEVTGRARDAVKKLQAVAKVIVVATAAASLAGAIASKDPAGIGRNAKSLYAAITAAG